MPNEKETRAQREKRKLDEQLDRELEQSFPASDSPTITRHAPDAQITPKPQSDK
jgi:hypothetical protein